MNTGKTKDTRPPQYCIQGNSRRTKEKEMISGPYESRDRALKTLACMAKYYKKTHTYARVAKMK